MNKKEKIKPVKSPSIEQEEFNTGVHSPDSLRNVGPGYDDTGMGNEKNTRRADKPTQEIRNPRTKRARSRNRQY